MRVILLAALLLTVSAYAGYRFFILVSKSRFFKSFSLEDAVKKVGHKGIDCFSSPSDAEAFEVGRSGILRYKPIPIECQIKEGSGNEFVESEFMRALHDEIEKVMKASGASVTRDDTPSSNNIYIEYKSGRIQGWIKISGERKGDRYNLRAELEERTK
jgi:hypothetical protein